MTKCKASLCIFAPSVLLIVFAGCRWEDPIPQDLSQGVAIGQNEMDALHEELAAEVTSAAANAMSQPGLVGALGGARIKLLKTGVHQLLLPLPQRVDGQVPVCYFIRSTPREAAIEYRLQKREDTNDVVSVQLQGDRDQEIQLDWSSVILVAPKDASSGNPHPDPYTRSSACVQAESDEIGKLAEQLWPEGGRVADYARNIQGFIREMKRAKQPRSLDALGILDSGANGICTANANLALALLRAKGIASRSMAVIPPTSQRLEMHRIVEYFQDSQWHCFDPSSLHVDIPMEPWQTVIMAKTTMADENMAMKPRMGSSLGVPYGQELELLSTGVTLWGQDFFWTIAKPLAEFQPDDDSIALAKDQWNHYLQEGTLSPGQLNAHSATNSRAFHEILNSE